MTVRRGMTLMELVIGLAITGMMALVGASAFGSVIDHRKTLETASISLERSSALRDMIQSWLYAGTIQIQRGGVPRGLNASSSVSTRGAGNTGTGMLNNASVSQAQAAGDEISFTTTAPNPAGLGSVRIRLYIDADANTPEAGLTIEYQPNALQPLVRRMLDSTIDTLKVEYLDSRTNRWFRASEAATLSGMTAARITLLHGQHGPLPPIVEIPMIFPMPTVGVTVRIQ
ncbi:MAG TPA: prepilin-type N-terminal cleavage/methylation domain-containing protein [Gemmatimonadaceae bacterium]|jgi:prepilin-type N-terminal cleavage/methylation domain-containing protein|nr:prepilin-type N-terminal cleavage/methylation domain-containing protein [Gemmatimonadaceae bacterium]